MSPAAKATAQTLALVAVCIAMPAAAFFHLDWLWVPLACGFAAFMFGVFWWNAYKLAKLREER